MEQLLFYIEESKQWTCPKSGAWKVICVGGGARGTLILDIEGSAYDKPKLSSLFSNVSLGQDRMLIEGLGGQTSFGPLTAKGSEGIDLSDNPQILSYCSGKGGYDGIEYGGLPSISLYDNSLLRGDKNSGNYISSGKGYGASGGSISTYAHVYLNNQHGASNNVTIHSTINNIGSIKTYIVKLADSEVVNCTVGKGGKRYSKTDFMSLFDELGFKYWSCNSKDEMFSHTNECLSSAGRDGVIILEYLGNLA